MLNMTSVKIMILILSSATATGHILKDKCPTAEDLRIREDN
jgi:hypothetical protein